MPKRKFFLAFICTVFFLGSAAGPSAAWQGKVSYVYDGDTVAVLKNSKKVKVRLYGIDTPERDQPYGLKAKQYTSSLVFGKKVEVVEKDTDIYGRTVAVIIIDGTTVNRELITAGYAWVYKRHCREDFCNEWQKEEAQSRKNRKGLWKDDNPVPPWEWRHKEKTAMEKLLDLVDQVLRLMRKIMRYIDMVLDLFGG